MVTERQLSAVLSEFAYVMVTDFDVQSILNSLVERIVEILPVTAAGVTLISPGVRPHYMAASNRDARRFEELQTELGQGPCVAAYESGQAVAVADLAVDPRFSQFASEALHAGMAAVFAFPLRHGTEQRIGALDLYRDEPGALPPETMTAAQTLADVAAAYVINAQGRQQLLDLSNQHLRASLHDPLTGLPNRVLVLERLEHAFLRERRSAKTMATIFIDLDRFKEVNDAHGHQVGDELLIAVARRLTESLRPGDTLGRLSGDEFVVLCEDLDSPSQADGIVDRIDTALARPYLLSGTEVTITASVGMTFTDNGNIAADRLLREADAAMYQAKRRGRRRQVLDLRDEFLAEQDSGLEGDLKNLVLRDELHLVYQPIVAIDGRITGVEALLRWDHPRLGAVSPTVLIPIAERSPAIIEIGRWVLERAWADRGRWPAADLAVSVNVSAHQLMSAGFAETVEEVLEADHGDPNLLTLEITESVFVRDPERVLVVLNRLTAMGVTLALDDFGTGYSSLIYLRRFPVGIVKVDRSFISDFLHAPASHSIVASVINLAHDLGMTVTAEGVETAEQHRELVSLACDSCQGFYFARPMPEADIGGSLSTLGDHGRMLLPLGH